MADTLIKIPKTLPGRGKYPKKYLQEIAAHGGRKKTRRKISAVTRNLALAMAARFPNSQKWNPGGKYDHILAKKAKKSLAAFRKGKQAKRKTTEDGLES